METRELYVLPARKMKRYTTSEEKLMLSGDIISYYAASMNIAAETTIGVKIPREIVIEKVDNIYKEMFSNAIVANLNEGGYENGVIINRNDLANMRLVTEEQAKDLYKDYCPRTIEFSLNMFICKAMKTICEQIETEREKKVKKLSLKR